MASFETWSHIQQQQMRFFYSLTTLTFVILGLSVQFSPSFGKLYPYLLITSWGVLLFSGVVGGWRLLSIPNLHRIDMHKQDIESYVRKVNEFEERVRTHPGPVKILGDAPDKDKMTKLNADLEKYQACMDTSEKNISWTYYVQVYGFILGISMNMVYVSINFLSR